MTNDELQKAVAGMDENALAALETSVREAREQKRAGFDISTIKAGMPAEDLARARAEINRVLAGR
jgi:hypothetical protein